MRAFYVAIEEAVTDASLVEAEDEPSALENGRLRHRSGECILEAGVVVAARLQIANSIGECGACIEI